MKTFGSRLRALRETRDWSQEKLGFELGVTKATISKWESGHVLPGLTTLLKIKVLFADQAVSLDFLGGDPAGPREDNPGATHRAAEPKPRYDADPRLARTQAELQLLLCFRQMSEKRQGALLKLLIEGS